MFEAVDTTYDCVRIATGVLSTVRGGGVGGEGVGGEGVRGEGVERAGWGVKW